jgi:hypothetical protein
MGLANADTVIISAVWLWSGNRRLLAVPDNESDGAWLRQLPITDATSI